MTETLSAYLPLDVIAHFAATPFGTAAVALVLLVATASVVALSLPGTLTPLSFTGGMLLGASGIAVVLLGALVGSHLLFLASRRYLAGFMQRRFGERLDGIGDYLAARGPLYVVGARLGGVPHLLVTAGCAATPISARAFLGASLLGMLPAISLAAIAGSAM
ncbi:VTT domain-containing protein [Aurantiacibacter spongiae]|uniref:VTT domain-containing protein n=1 Tax=Aurantiacibacter spongiae TaxID=2488860 RepID=A0A3N5DPU0_9SPHN|nr:VTT domain-containing protein [Aurantiacibacter spongiae]RPF71151.1 hypothetical protein EG799_05640 [Aurantiacibacter spongiae]